ncbi:MAG: large conductance mechanosensitive channel protein MscL [Chthoniobacterales bacterium]|nr:large conductance mechanosensitive channel protein MscL [Chthoniobacterales bacterium]
MTPRLLKEFKDFISRGNMIDLAVGIIIGAAFGKVVNSLVNDLVMPPIGLLLKGINFQNLFFALNGHHYETLKAAQEAGAATINYGNFITTVIEFLIIGASVFGLVRVIMILRINASLTAPPNKTEQLLTEIRDTLQQQKEN